MSGDLSQENMAAMIEQMSAEDVGKFADDVIAAYQIMEDFKSGKPVTNPRGARIKWITVEEARKIYP